MKKQTTMLLGMILLLSSISAIALYAGEEITLVLDEEYSYYSIVGNSTPIDLTVTPHGNNVTISVGKYNQLDNFELIFFDKEKEVIVQHHYSSGSGGTRTKYVDRNVTGYVDRNVTTYLDSEPEIVYEDVEVIVGRESVWTTLIIIGLATLSSILIGILFFRWGRK